MALRMLTTKVVIKDVHITETDNSLLVFLPV